MAPKCGGGSNMPELYHGEHAAWEHRDPQSTPQFPQDRDQEFLWPIGCKLTKGSLVSTFFNRQWRIDPIDRNGMDLCWFRPACGA
jgi:hypothetical protein